jgi:glycosyltransferase involved in cell wall biosynthesis
MKKKLSYFLSYSGSVKDHIDVGCLPRLEKEIEFLSRTFDLTVYGKDDQEFLTAYGRGATGPAVVYRGVRWCGGALMKRSDNKFIRVIVSIIRLFEYWFAVPFYYRRNIQSADCCLVKHVSSGVGLALYKKCRLLKPKLITRYNWSWSGFARRQCRGAQPFVVRHLERFALNNSDEILAGDELLRKQVQSVVGPGVHVEVIPNWIDTQAFVPLPLAKDNDVIAIGRLSYQKNHELLLESVETAQKTLGHAIRVTIIGRGRLKQGLEDQARARGIELKILDVVPNDAIPGLLSRSRIFMLTSRYEGNPKVLLEAMACAMPIVATRIEGVANVIRDGFSGVVCDPDRESLGRALAGLLNDEKRRDTLAHNARGLAESVFSFDNVMAALVRKIH